MDKLAVNKENQNAALAKLKESNAMATAVSMETDLIPAIDKAFRFQLPRLGKIHLGVKVKTQSGKEYPKSTEYFVLPEILLNDDEFRESLEAIGQDPKKPQVLPIKLACNSIGDNLRTSCDLYGLSKGLICRTYDGARCTRVDQKSGELIESACAYELCSDYKKGDCHWIHRFRFVLPTAAGIGVWQIDSTSLNNRAQLLAEMSQIKAFLGGKLAGVDLYLTLEPREFQNVPAKDRNGETKLIKTTAWLMHIRAPFSINKMVKIAQEQSIGFEDVEVGDFDTSADDMPTVVEQPQEEVKPESIPNAEFVEEKAQTTNGLSCTACNAKITEAVSKFSKDKYGVALCMKCQKVQSNYENPVEQDEPQDDGYVNSLMMESD